MWSAGYKFKIQARLDSDYATNPDDCRSISGGQVFMNDIPITFRSVTQKFVTLSVTEEEIAAGVMVAQDMLYIYRLMESLELEVDLPMVLEMDNSGAVDMDGKQLECRWQDMSRRCMQLFSVRA
jgi:hypothetical protein